MKHTIEFETGETTCAIEPGKLCRFCASQNFGQQAWCGLVKEPIYDKNGWLQRTKSCMKRFPNET